MPEHENTKKSKSAKHEKSKDTKKKVEEKCPPTRNKPLIIGASIAIGLLLLVGAYFIFTYIYQDKIFPGVKLEEVSVSGMTEKEVETLIDNYSQALSEDGLDFTYEDTTYNLKPDVFSVENPEISYEVISLDSQDTAKNIFDYGRNGNFWQNLGQQLKALFAGKSIALEYIVLDQEVTDNLNNEFNHYETPAQNATLSFDEFGEIVVTEEESGEVFDFADILNQLKNRIASLSNETIALRLVEEIPIIKKSEAEPLIAKTEEVIAAAPYTLTYNENVWDIQESDVKQFLEFAPDGVEFNQDKMSAFLTNLGNLINQDVKEGKYQIVVDSGSQAVGLDEIQEPENGQALDWSGTVAQMNNELIANKGSEAGLVVETTYPVVSSDNLEEIGITDLLGTGTTNMSGSPSNRIVNITKGADMLHGLLIPPGEQFSLITALGKIDGEHGWLPELVIKENKTIPEYGGGLCQIGTTSFRMAMNSGLPIIERRNHSYVVSYYNYMGKPGVDATIYDPKPDFIFKNDTGNWMLIQTHISGNDIYFDMWGTSDGREGSFTEPENFDFVSAPPTLEIETDALSPGARNCTEKAHNGVSAKFDYIIKWPDGSEDVETFYSKYKALPAVCEVGKAEEPAPEEASPEEAVEPTPAPEEEIPDNADKKKKKKD
ncbi:VanW family protein [Patescibacteria group bacterium]|nr:VanW family protein [Patescibacteria group bacterium]MBU1673206.1 VanW family protein [Patescibacteria group bacterium]MBU1963014.1 VanW family protein [Patescibacteria group bacterium]